MTDIDMRGIEQGFARLNIVGERAAKGVMDLIDIGARLGTSSKGTHGISSSRTGNSRQDALREVQ